MIRSPLTAAPACLAVLLAAPPAAPAQVIAPAVPWYVNPVVTPYGVGYGYAPYGYGGTADYAAAQGMADVIRARGEYNKATAEARQAEEEARSKYLDNQVKWLQAYHEHKRLGEERRDAENAADRERAQRYASLNRQRQPQLLGRSEIDPATGRLLFPTGLLDDSFADQRARLQTLFTERAAAGADPRSDAEIADLATAMLAELKTQIRTMPPADYIAARSFLEHARNEATARR